MKKYLLLLFFYLLSVNLAFAQKDAIDGKSYILCINSYTEASPWSSRLISNVTEFVQKDPEITLYVEHLNMLLVENDSILEESKRNIFDKYKGRSPRCCYYWEIRRCCCGMNIEKFGETFLLCFVHRKIIWILMKLIFTGNFLRRKSELHFLIWLIPIIWYICMPICLLRKTFV